jgi:hypothetical protein
LVGGRGGVRVAGVSATVRVRVGASCAGVRAGVLAGLGVGFVLCAGRRAPGYLVRVRVRVRGRSRVIALLYCAVLAGP